MEIIPLEQIRLLNQKDHHLHSYAENIPQIADSLLGLHSARLPTPYIILKSRIKDINTIDLYNDLFENRNLIKLRCMRKTLHTTSYKFAPIVHKSTLLLRTQEINRYYKINNINADKLLNLKDYLVNVIKREPLDKHTIFNIINEKLPSKPSLTNLHRVILKDLWENGELCYINNNTKWEKEDRVYGHTETIYPSLNLNKISFSEAVYALIYNYIKQFGPVTIKDMTWWSGISVIAIREALTKMEPFLKEIKIEGCVSICYILSEKLDTLYSLPNDKGVINMLAYEDSSLKGYYETRHRYIDMKYYDRLFNQIGEVRASIVLDGIAIGIWNWNNKQKKVDYFLFDEKKYKKFRFVIDKKAEEMECYLYR